MELAAPAMIVAVRAHGEHGSIVRALTREAGLRAGYVRGGRSTRLRPVLQPGNTILGRWRARTDEQLAGLTVELVESRAALYGEPLAAAALDWLAALTAAALPEAQSYPRLYDALDGVIGAIVAAPAARGWAAAVARFELLLLADLGFGLDLDRCAVTGAGGGVAYVSPRTGAGVSQAGAGQHAPRLLAVPRFLIDGGEATWSDIIAGLALTGHFLARDILTDRRAEPLAARERLIDRLRRAIA